jgi:hypothetical protein
MKYNHVDEENSVAVGNAWPVYLYTTLKDSIGNCNIKKQRKIPIRVSAECNVLDICIKGYGNCVVTLEIWNGQLRLIVWADRNSEEPTHIINLEGAKEKVNKPKTKLAIR